MQSLQNHILIAMPNMGDPMFSRTVTLICEHNEKGAMGIIINRVTQYIADDLIQQLVDKAPEQSINADFAQSPIHIGGPVQTEQGFVLHSTEQDWQQCIHVSNKLALSSSRDVLDALMLGQGPERYLLTLGYAGWEAGQLEQELSENAWLHGPADADMLFDTPAEQLWTTAAKSIGIDIHLLDKYAGHA